MGILGALFSSKEIVGKAVSLADDSVRGIGNWIDELQLTEQEKAELRMKLLHEMNGFIADRLRETGAQTLSRRVLAWMIMATFLFTFLLGVFSYIFDPAWAAFILRWINASGMYWLVLSVGSFYFGTHMLREILARKSSGKS